MEEHTLTFTAQSADSQEFIIHEYTDIIDAGTMDDPNATIRGMKELRTSDGQAVNCLEKGKYRIVNLDLIVTSDSPDAP